MVNYHDPTTVAKESRACAFRSTFRGLEPDLLIGLFDRGACALLACHGWYIYVSLTVLPR